MVVVADCVVCGDCCCCWRGLKLGQDPIPDARLPACEGVVTLLLALLLASEEEQQEEMSSTSEKSSSPPSSLFTLSCSIWSQTEETAAAAAAALGTDGKGGSGGSGGSPCVSRPMPRLPFFSAINIKASLLVHRFIVDGEVPVVLVGLPALLSSASVCCCCNKYAACLSAASCNL